MDGLSWSSSPPPETFKRQQRAAETLNRLANFIARTDPKQGPGKGCLHQGPAHEDRLTHPHGLAHEDRLTHPHGPAHEDRLTHPHGPAHEDRLTHPHGPAHGGHLTHPQGPVHKDLLAHSQGSVREDLLTHLPRPVHEDFLTHPPGSVHNDFLTHQNGPAHHDLLAHLHGPVHDHLLNHLQVPLHDNLLIHPPGMIHDNLLTHQPGLLHDNLLTHQHNLLQPHGPVFNNLVTHPNGPLHNNVLTHPNRSIHDNLLSHQHLPIHDNLLTHLHRPMHDNLLTHQHGPILDNLLTHPHGPMHNNILNHPNGLMHDSVLTQQHGPVHDGLLNHPNGPLHNVLNHPNNNLLTQLRGPLHDTPLALQHRQINDHLLPQPHPHLHAEAVSLLDCHDTGGRSDLRTKLDPDPLRHQEPYHDANLLPLPEDRPEDRPEDCPEDHPEDRPENHPDVSSLSFAARTKRNLSLPAAQVPHESERKVGRNLFSCTPCGQGFMLKQALLHHQQAGCEPQSSASETPLPFEEEDSASSSEAPSEQRRSGAQDGQGVQDDQGTRDTQDTNCWGSSAGEEPPPARTASASRAEAFRCRSCERAFYSADGLTLHRTEMHRKRSKVAAEHYCAGPQIRLRKTSYTCQVCSQVFFRHLSLWALKKRHPGFTPRGAAQNYSLIRNADSCQLVRNTDGNVDGNQLEGKAGPMSKVVSSDVFVRESKLSNNFASVLHKPRLCPSLLKRLKSSRPPNDEQEHCNDDSDAEFPCASCPEVFSCREELTAHSELHQASVKRSHCAVCQRGMDSLRRAGSKRMRLYHCLLCQTGFNSLQTFLSHCQQHLKDRTEEDT